MPEAKTKTDKPGISSDDENEEPPQKGAVVLRTNSNNITDDSCVCRTNEARANVVRANVTRSNAPTNGNNVHGNRVTSDSEYEFERILFYDLPCSQNFLLDETDLSNIKFWLKSGTVDHRDLP